MYFEYFNILYVDVPRLLTIEAYRIIQCANGLLTSLSHSIYIAFHKSSELIAPFSSSPHKKQMVFRRYSNLLKVLQNEVNVKLIQLLA